MTVLISAPRVSRPPGTYNLPGVVLGAPANSLTIAIGRAGLPDGPVASINMELSHDGVSWVGIGGCTLDGGIALDRQGNVLTESFYTITPDVPFLATDRVRATVVLFQTVTTSVEVR